MLCREKRSGTRVGTSVIAACGKPLLNASLNGVPVLICFHDAASVKVSELRDDSSSKGTLRRLCGRALCIQYEERQQRGSETVSGDTAVSWQASL